MNNGYLRSLNFNNQTPSIVDEYNSELTFVGYIKKGLKDMDDTQKQNSPIWIIQLIKKSGSVTEVLYAEGSTDFDKIWENRYTFDYYLP